MYVYQSLCQSGFMFVFLFYVCMSFTASVCLSIWLYDWKLPGLHCFESIYLSLCLFVCKLAFCLFIHLPVFVSLHICFGICLLVSAYLFAGLCECRPIRLFCSLSVCLYVCVPVSLSVCLSLCLTVCHLFLFMYVCVYFYMYFCLSGCMSVYLSVLLCVMSVCLFVCISLFLSVCLSVCMSVCLSVCMCVRLYV